MYFTKPRANILGALLSCSCAFAAADSFKSRLVTAAIDRTFQDVHYDGSYFRIDYPGGDVPADRGVCADVLIRAYKQVGVDLQKEVHEDIAASFDAYPSKRI